MKKTISIQKEVAFLILSEILYLVVGVNWYIVSLYYFLATSVTFFLICFMLSCNCNGRKGKNMSAIERITKAAHLIDMKDIIREGNPTLRAVAEEVSFPLSDQDIILGEKMMQFLKHSQDPVMAEKLGLRGGVGLAAPQLDISKRIIAVLVPNITEEGETPQEAYDLQAVMYNPKIVSHSVQDAALGEGEGCLSVDRAVPGYVIRHARVTVDYFDKDGEKHRIKLKGYNSIVVQHEIDHLNGIMFYDRINEKDPFEVKDGLLILE